MKRFLALLVFAIALPALAQNKTKAQLAWTYAPPASAGTTVACSATVTSNCILNFQVWRLAPGSSTPDASKDTLVGTAPIVLNADGSINTSAGAQSYVTPDQPFGSQTYYVVAIAAATSTTNTVASVPTLGNAVVISPFPASGVGGGPK